MRRLKTVTQLLTAITLSTLCVVPLYFLVSVLSGDLNSVFLIPLLIMAAALAFIVVLFVGLPIHFILVRRRLLRPRHYALPAFFIPALTVAVFHPFGEDGALWISWQAILMGFFGAIVALVFRRFALGTQSFF